MRAAFAAVALFALGACSTPTTGGGDAGDDADAGQDAVQGDGGGDAGSDSGGDAADASDAADAAEDAASDAASDAGEDAASDAGEDAASDAGEDAASDAGEDAASDAGEDAASDAGDDAASDGGGDAGPVGCTTGAATCAEHATCIDIADGFFCQCNPGYTGNGATACVAADNCAAYLTTLRPRGAYTEPANCSACIQVTPDDDPANVVTLSAGETTWDMSGMLTGTLSAEPRWYAAGGAGTVNAGVIDESSGYYDTVLPVFCGTTLVTGAFSSAEGCTLTVHEVHSTCTEPDIRITLTWDAVGRDMELHLIKPGGKLNQQSPPTDCTWTTCIDSHPDWGVPGDASDDPAKDVDNTSAYGPENIVLSGPEAGEYTVMVEHWQNGAPPAHAQVAIFLAGHLAFVDSVDNMASHWLWDVARIDGTNGTITPKGDLIDCTGAWTAAQGGCGLSVP